MKSERATATLEFAMVLPIFFMIVLVVIQFALMVNARLVVGYGAYAAARAAVVSTDGGSEGAKHRAQKSAALACMAISPALEPDVNDGRLSIFFAHSLRLDKSPLDSFEKFSRRWRRAGPKLRYAQDHTSVEIEGADARRRFGPRDPVTAVVTHEFHMGVPYAGATLGQLLGERRGRFYVLPISVPCTLLNEGKVRTEPKPGKAECRGVLRKIIDLVRGAFNNRK